MKFLTLLLISGFSLNAFAGGDRTGNGGIGVICRDDSKKIVSAELLDFYEARMIHHWMTKEGVAALDRSFLNRESAAIWGINASTNIFKNFVSLNHYSSYSILLLNTFFGFVGGKESRALGEDAKLYYEGKQVESDTTKSLLTAISIHGYKTDLFGKVRVIDPSTKLAPTSDFTSVLIPKGCAFEQIATYGSDNLLWIDSELFDALSPTNQGALFFHEAVWSIQRQAGLTSSDLARKLVAATYSFMAAALTNRPTKELIRWVASLATLTLDLNYNYDKHYIFDLLELDEAERGKISFGYVVSGDEKKVKCTVKTVWQDRTENRDLAEFAAETWWENKSSVLYRRDLEVNGFIPEYQSMRYTTLGPEKITCSLVPGHTTAKVSLLFRIWKGTKVIYEAKTSAEFWNGSFELSPEKKTQTQRNLKPILFF